jgi:hypothetical protein
MYDNDTLMGGSRRLLVHLRIRAQSCKHVRIYQLVLAKKGP